MANPVDDPAFRKRMERIEHLLHAAEESSDPQALARTREIVQTVLDLHGVALERLLATVAQAGDAGREMIAAAAWDNLVGSVLLLHNLHPLDLEARVRLALDEVRPQLRSHGGDVEILSLADGFVRLRIQGSERGCHSTAQQMRAAVERAMDNKAPDAVAVEIEEAAAGPAVAFIPVQELVRKDGRRGAGL
jgi:Fe-S cluster biogenesis protein NfuA